MHIPQCARCGATEASKSFLGMRCSVCKVSYCNKACQRQDWAEHKVACPEIAKVGVEQYVANAAAADAAVDAVDEYSMEVDQVSCYVCLNELGGRDGVDAIVKARGDGKAKDGTDGIVRGCGCEEKQGYAHLSCLMAAAARSCTTATGDVDKWTTCGLCGVTYGGAVGLALARECWRAHLSLPESSLLRCNALKLLGDALGDVELHEESLRCRIALVDLRRRRFPGDADSLLEAESGLAGGLFASERDDEALELQRRVYDARLARHGPRHEATITEALDLAVMLDAVGRQDEQETLLRATLPDARAALGPDHAMTVGTTHCLAALLWHRAEEDPSAVVGLSEAAALVQDCIDASVRVHGEDHVSTRGLKEAAAQIRLARDEPDACVPMRVDEPSDGDVKISARFEDEPGPPSAPPAPSS